MVYLVYLPIPAKAYFVAIVEPKGCALPPVVEPKAPYLTRMLENEMNQKYLVL